MVFKIAIYISADKKETIFVTQNVPDWLINTLIMKVLQQGTILFTQWSNISN